MTHAWLRLEADETVEWETHPRLMRAAPGVVASVVLAGVAVAGGTILDPLGYALVMLAPVPTVYVYLRVVNTRYVVSDRALYRKTGVVGIDLRTVERGRVQNTRSTQGVLGAAFGYGTVEVEVAGGADVRFAGVYDPVDVRRRIERIAGGGASAIPGSLEQWRAVREEVRAIRRALADHPKNAS